MEANSASRAKLRAGRYAVYTGGVLGSASALYDFAVDYGGWNHYVGILLPLSLDVYWMTALGVAMDSSRDNGVRIKAAGHAAVAIIVSIAGNVLYHELHGGDLRLSRFMIQILVAIGGAVPVLAAGALTHLTILTQADRKPETGNAPPAGETATGRARSPRPGGNGNRARNSGSGSIVTGSAETAASSAPAERPGSGSGVSPEPEAPAPQPAAHSGNLAVVPGSPDDGPETDAGADGGADAMTRAREIAASDPGILYRRGGPTALGLSLDLTARRGRQLAAALRAERAPEDAAGAS